MTFWRYIPWFDAPKRAEQMDEHIRSAGVARFGQRLYQEEEKHEAVRRHFNRVAPKYDFMNSLLSMGIQHVWKRAAIRMLGIQPGNKVLDVCGGTGDHSTLSARAPGR